MLLFYNFGYLILHAYYFVHYIILWIMACRKHDDRALEVDIEDNIGADLNVRPMSPVTHLEFE